MACVHWEKGHRCVLWAVAELWARGTCLLPCGPLHRAAPKRQPMVLFNTAALPTETSQAASKRNNLLFYLYFWSPCYSDFTFTLIQNYLTFHFYLRNISTCIKIFMLKKSMKSKVGVQQFNDNECYVIKLFVFSIALDQNGITIDS